jgi:hypothetical protein
MQVAHLLDFESALLCDGFPVTLTKDEEIVLIAQLLGDTFAFLPALETHSKRNG